MGAIAARRLGWKYQIRGGGGTGFVADNPDYDIPSFLGQIRQGALDVGPVDWLVIEGGGNDKDYDPELVTRRAVRTLTAAANGTPRPAWCWSGPWTPPSTASPTPTASSAGWPQRPSGWGIPYIDAQHWLEGHPELIGPDYDHPTPAGHRLCGRKLARALAALG